MAKINPSTNIPNTKSADYQWVEWHKAMKTRYGKKTANTLFLEAWQRRQSGDANTVALRNYLEKNDIGIEGGVFSFTADVLDDVGSYYSSLFSFGKWIGIVLIIILVVGIAMIIFNVAKRPVETARAIADARSGGMGGGKMGDGGSVGDGGNVGAGE